MKFDKFLNLSKVVCAFLIAIAIFLNGLVMWEGVKVKRCQVTAEVFLKTPQLNGKVLELMVAGFSLEEVLEYYYSAQYLFGKVE